MHSMFGRNAYVVAMIQHFSFTFFPFFAFPTQLFLLQLGRQTSATKFHCLRSSAFCREPYIVLFCSYMKI